MSRAAGSLRYDVGCWWVHNDSQACLLHVSGDRGFRAELPPGMRLPVQQWHAKVRLKGMLGSYTLLLRLPGLDEEPDTPAALPGAGAVPHDAAAGGSAAGDTEAGRPGAGLAAVGAAGLAGSLADPAVAAAVRPGHPGEPVAGPGTGERAITTMRYRPGLTESDRLMLAARFESYLNWRSPGVAVPCTAEETAKKIGWRAHAVVKRCENIRDRYARHGAPGLRGARALEELAALLISTGELTPDDLRRLPARNSAG